MITFVIRIIFYLVLAAALADVGDDVAGLPEAQGYAVVVLVAKAFLADGILLLNIVV